MEFISDLYNNIEKKHKKLITFLLFLPYVYSINLPGGNIAFLDDFFTIARVFCAAIIVFLFLFVKKRKPSKLTVIIILMEMWQLLATVLTNHKWVVAVYDLCACVAIPLLIELFIDDAKELLLVMLFCFEIQLYPNLLTLLFKFNVDGRGIGWYLLGQHNMLATMLLPAAGVSIVSFRFTSNKLRSSLLLFVAIISCFLCECSTAEVAMAGSIALFVVGYMFREKIQFPLWLLFAGAVFGSLFIIFAFSDTSFTLLNDLIVNVLHRDVTFTGRTYIWGNAVKMIEKSPIIGYGFRTIVPMFETTMVGHAHNYFLDKAVVAGIPMLILIILMHLELSRGCSKQRNSIYKIALTAIICGMFLTYLTESYFRFYRFIIVFALIYNLDAILSNKKSEEN